MGFNLFSSNKDKSITLAEIQAEREKELAKDMTGWVRTRMIIDFYENVVEVRENEELVGYSIDFLLKMDNVIDRNLTLSRKSVLYLIHRYYIPKSHIHSFGRYTGVIVLFNPKSEGEIIIDPNQKPWHYDSETN